MSANGVNYSQQLGWLLTRKNSSFVMKQSGLRHRFSRDPLNPKGIHASRFQGITNARHATVQEGKDRKGVVLVTKTKRASQPARLIVRSNLNRGPRRTMQSIRRFVNKNSYRKDLRMLLLRRASAIIKSQIPRKAPRAPKKGGKKE